MLEKVGQGFCSDWFHRSNENPVKTSLMEIASVSIVNFQRVNAGWESDGWLHFIK